MQRYLLLMRASEEGALGILNSGSSGAAGQCEAIKALGGKVVEQYVVIGQYDLVVVVDVPDEATALAISLSANIGGLYTEAMRAYQPSEVDAARSKLL